MNPSRRLLRSFTFLSLVLLLHVSGFSKPTDSYPEKTNASFSLLEERPLIGEIRLFTGNYVPFPGQWATCDGSMLKATTYSSLFALIGNKYGGDGKPNFALPKLTSPVAGARYIICIANGIYPKPNPNSPNNAPEPPKPPAPPPPIERAVLGEVRLFSGSYVPYPHTWQECNGQLLKIEDYQNGLYQILGTRYGGDGVTTFALPNLKSPVEGARYLIAVFGFYPTKK